MSTLRSRQIILVWVAFAVGAGSLLVPGSALADTALFRIEQSWFNFPVPVVTSPGNAGLYQGYIQPYNYGRTPMGAYTSPPATAIVEPGNPIGGAFTLPQSFIDVVFTNTITPKTGWPGYTTITQSLYYNGPGKFGPNHGSNASNVRVVFPTTLGNPVPNYGDGNPVTPTTTFDGLYDHSRGGSINVTPGPRRFGGTFRAFYRPEANFYQFVYYFTPALYKAYAHFQCINDGVTCTPGNFVSHIGDTTAIYRATNFLLNVKGTGTGDQLQSATAKATTPINPDLGGYPTPGGNASFLTRAQQYLNLIHPWTTGFASVKNAKGSPNVLTPQSEGYDISLGGVDKITVTHYDWNAKFHTQLETITYSTVTYKQYLYNVDRVVSMVRPRLIHTFARPFDLSTDPITNTWQVARMWRLKVFFLPEPAGMLLLGVGIGALLVLNRMRRR